MKTVFSWDSGFHLPHEFLLKTCLEFKMWSRVTWITKSIQTARKRKSIERAWAIRDAVISSFSIAQNWFPGSTVYGPDSFRSSCVAIILPFIFIHHSFTSGSRCGEESMPNSKLPPWTQSLEEASFSSCSSYVRGTPHGIALLNELSSCNMVHN